jgi:hypothetical protein
MIRSAILRFHILVFQITRSIDNRRYAALGPSSL